MAPKLYEEKVPSFLKIKIMETTILIGDEVF